MYHYKECGLNNIYLRNGYEQVETAEGIAVGIHAVDELMRVIAEGVATKRGHLTGRELRFLRVELDLSQKALGELMGKSDQSVANWEKGEVPIPVLADKAIRDMYLESIGKGPVAGLLKDLSQLDRQYHELKCELEETALGWQLKECA